jgi:hypothetical protein
MFFSLVEKLQLLPEIPLEARNTYYNMLKNKFNIS